jgi:hypothetical protein
MRWHYAPVLCRIDLGCLNIELGYGGGGEWVKVKPRMKLIGKRNGSEISRMPSMEGDVMNERRE